MSTPTPAIGQRWLSDAETELGLGMVIEVNPRTVTILFPKSEETRVYARQNAPLSRIRFTETEFNPRGFLPGGPAPDTLRAATAASVGAAPASI